MIDDRPIPFRTQPVARRLLRVGFVMEQALGHVTYTQNLQAAFTHEPAIEPRWFPVRQGREGPFGRVPLLRRNWTALGSLRAYAALRGNTADLDALFFHTQTMALLAPLAARRLPAILSLDATPANMDSFGAHYGLRDAPGRVERSKRGLHRRVYARAAGFTTWSQWAKNSLRDDYGVDPDLITVIHPGIDLDRFPEPPERPLRQRPRLLFVGGDFARKGGPELLAAMRGGLAELCDLDVVTPAPVPETPGVRVHSDLGPNDPRLLALYRDADVFVLPTHADCLAVAIGEALAAGLPVVTTDVGGQPEAVDDGLSGLIVPPGEVEPLGRALRRLVEDATLRRTMGRLARRTAVERFDARTNARRLLDVIEDGIDRWQQRRSARRPAAPYPGDLVAEAEAFARRSDPPSPSNACGAPLAGTLSPQSPLRGGAQRAPSRGKRDENGTSGAEGGAAQVSLNHGWGESSAGSRTGTAGTAEPAANRRPVLRLVGGRSADVPGADETGRSPQVGLRENENGGGRQVGPGGPRSVAGVDGWLPRRSLASLASRSADEASNRLLSLPGNEAGDR